MLGEQLHESDPPVQITPLVLQSGDAAVVDHRRGEVRPDELRPAVRPLSSSTNAHALVHDLVLDAMVLGRIIVLR